MTYTKKQREYVNKLTAQVNEARGKSFEQYLIDSLESLTGIRVESIDSLSDDMVENARQAYERKLDGIVEVQYGIDSRTIDALSRKGFITFVGTAQSHGMSLIRYRVNMWKSSKEGSTK